jgi:hypothetical protein
LSSSIALVSCFLRLPEVVALLGEEIVAVAQGGVFLDGDEVDGTHAGHAVTQVGDLAHERRPVGGLHRGEVLGGRFAATGDGLRRRTGALLVGLFEVIEAGDAFGFAVGKPELEAPVDVGDVELMVGPDLLDDEAALRGPARRARLQGP